MKKRPILKVSGTITLLMVLSCFFAACEEDDHPVTVKSISFYQEEQALENGIPAFDPDGVPIMTKKEVNDKNPFTLDKDPRNLYIICEVPSKISEPSVTVAYDPALIVLESSITSGKLLQVSPKKTTSAGKYIITVTADPGGISGKCTVVVK
jgi:hypothetical protein